MTAPEGPIPYQRTTCRICGAALEPLLSLGSLYLSDFPASAGTKAHPPVPLELMRCGGPCGLVQLAHTTPGEWLYGQYWYRSGVNEAMVRELHDVVKQALAWVDLPKGSTVIDIGANDGTLLAQYPLLGQKKLLTVGWEPARNLYEACRPHAQVLFPEFFWVEQEWPLEQKARLVSSIAMFYDLDDPHRFVAGVAKVLHPQGVWVIQQAYLPDMLATNGFDNIVHEHLEYYHLHPLEVLLAAHGLEVFHVEERSINGGSFRAYVQHKGARPLQDSVGFMRQAEQARLTPAAFAGFVQDVGYIRGKLPEVLREYQNHGLEVDLYAASTKCNTLLQACGIDAKLVRQAWERSPEKVGRYVGVSGIPIVAEEAGRADPPAALLVGAFQFRQQFLRREADYLAQGGALIFPLPQIEILRGQVQE